MKLEKAGPPTPFKEQKSVEVIEKKEEEFSLVQKSEGIVPPKLEIGKTRVYPPGHLEGYEKRRVAGGGLWK